MDVHNKKQRSYNMSQIRGMNAKPEFVIGKFLNDLKVPHQIHEKSLPGKPDFFIPDLNLIIEVFGCFWHGHKNCRFFVVPHTNTYFWVNKIESNILRDRKVKAHISKLGLRQCVIWECEIKNGDFLKKLLKALS